MITVNETIIKILKEIEEWAKKEKLDQFKKLYEFLHGSRSDIELKNLDEYIDKKLEENDIDQIQYDMAYSILDKLLEEIAEGKNVFVNNIYDFYIRFFH